MAILIEELFTANHLGEYTFDQGTSATGMVVAGGELTFTDSNDHSFHIPALKAGDALHTVKVTRGGGSHLPTIYLMLKWIDEENFLIAMMDENALELYAKVAGSYTLVESVERSFVEGKPEWLWARVTGNKVKFGVSTVDPRLEPAAGIEREGTLAGAAAAALGTGIEGAIGLRLASYFAGFHSNETAVTDWIVGEKEVLGRELAGSAKAASHFTGTLRIPSGSGTNVTGMIL